MVIKKKNKKEKEIKKPKKEKKEKKTKEAVKKRIVKKKEEKISPLKIVREVKPSQKPKPFLYWEGIGRRKTSVARVRIFSKGEKEILVNDKLYQSYFPTLELQKIVISPLEKLKCLDKFRLSCRAKGGGIHSQAEAVRHGLARALVKINPDFMKALKKEGFLTRNPRMRERKKFGLKRARRAPQWQKR